MKSILIAILTLVIIGCTAQPTVIPDRKDAPLETEVTLSWKDIPLTDVLTGEEYTLSQFEGQAVLLESFAVWCPTCLKQQKEIKEFKTSNPDVISVALDTDPNEKAQQVIDHANKNGLAWRFSISPIEMTQGLIDEFGVTVVNAPSAPVVLICEDQSSSILPNGVKTAEDLTELINERCQA